MARVLILSRSEIDRDPRVSRQIEWLGPDHQIVTAGLTPPVQSVERHINLQSRSGGLGSRFREVVDLKLRNRAAAYWRQFGFQNLSEDLGESVFDLVIANDIEALPAAVELSGSAKVLWDAHEYSPTQYDNRLRWRFFVKPVVEWICRTYINRVDKMTTVCEPIAVQYEAEFGVRPLVVLNAPGYVPSIVPRKTTLPIRMVHHGVAAHDRGIETIVHAAGARRTRVTLDLMLVSQDHRFMSRLEHIASAYPNVRLRAPVSRTEIVSTISAYDVGIFVLPPVTINKRFALPNKLFEFTQARLCCVVGPSDTMAGVVRDRKLGFVTEGFSVDNVVRTIDELSPEGVDAARRNADVAAADLCSETQAPVFRRIVSELVDDEYAESRPGEP